MKIVQAQMMAVLLSQLVDVTITSPTNGQSLIYNTATSKWINGTPTGSLPALTSGKIWVGNSSNVATAVTMSGDGSISTAGLLTVTKINGKEYVGTPSDGDFWVYDSGTGTFVLTANCCSLMVLKATPTVTATFNFAENDLDNVGNIIHNEVAVTDFTIQNVDLDKDILFSGNDGGVQTTIMSLDVSAGQLSGMLKAVAGVLTNASAGTDYQAAGAYLLNIVEDTTPQLGGSLDCQENNIDNIGDLIHDKAIAADFTIQNIDQDMDIIFSGNDGGVQTPIMTLDVSAGQLSGVLMATVGVLGPADATSVTALVSASSLTVAGKVELATTAEIDAGVDTTRAIPVDQWVASKRNVRFITIRVVGPTTACVAASGTALNGDFECPITGTIVEVGAYNDVAGSVSGGPSVFDIHLGAGTIMNVNKILIDINEKTSRTAAAPAPVLTTTAIAAGDILTFYCDTITGTGPQGLTFRIGIRES